MIGSDFFDGTEIWPSFFISRLATSHHFLQSSLMTSGTSTCWIWSTVRLASVAVAGRFDQIQMMERGHLANGVDIVDLAGQNMVFGNRLEVFGGERQVHRVAWFARKIDRETRKHGVHGLDLAKTPAPVNSSNRFRLTASNSWTCRGSIFRRGQFFKFLFHIRF